MGKRCATFKPTRVSVGWLLVGSWISDCFLSIFSFHLITIDNAMFTVVATDTVTY